MFSNGDFSNGTVGWDIYSQSNGSGSISENSGRLAINVNATGDCEYAVQAYCYDELSLVQGAQYTLSYDISASINRDVEVLIQQNGGSYSSYVWNQVSLTSSEQHVEQTFTMSGSTDSAARFVVNCGNQSGSLGNHSVYLDNVSLVCMDDNISSGGDSGNDSVGAGDQTIILNQVGYYPDQQKIAVFRSVGSETQFDVVNASTGETVYTGTLTNRTYNSGANETNYQGDFSSVTEPGTYYISCGDMTDSYKFTIK